MSTKGAKSSDLTNQLFIEGVEGVSSEKAPTPEASGDLLFQDLLGVEVLYETPKQSLFP